MVQQSALVGSLVGTAVGDALGLPYEGLSRRRAARLLGPPDRFRLLPGRGMVSDDTEHACLAAQALIAAGDDVERFRIALARGLRLWFFGAPAGIGLATLKACLRLCVGVHPTHSGVYSAGNGPAMRAPILGCALNDLDQLTVFVPAATRITHTDPMAEQGALAVALAARHASRGESVAPQEFVAEFAGLVPAADRLQPLLEQMGDSLAVGQTTVEFAETLGLARGVSGFVLHTVPVVLHAWLRNQHDYRGAVSAVINCGGDTDTTAAIVGGIVGAGVGPEGIPAEWQRSLWEWPRNVRWLELLAHRLTEVRQNHQPGRPPRLPAYGVLPRNAVFATVVLAHGFRRLLPPY